MELDLSLTNTLVSEAGEVTTVRSQTWAGLVSTSLGLVEPGDKLLLIITLINVERLTGD